MSILSASGNVRIAGIAADFLAGAITNSHGGGTGGGPSFIPALNTLGLVGNNTLNSIDPCPAGNCAYQSGGAYHNLVDAWNSAVFSPDYSTLGAYVLCGGGDHDYWGNQIAVFPLETLAWEARPLSGPSPWAGFQGVPGQNFTSGEWQDGSPMMPHTNDAMIYLPPNMGGGNKGSLMLPNASYCWFQSGSAAGHRCDIETGVWSKATQFNGSNTHEATYVLDTNRNEVFGFCAISSDQDHFTNINNFNASGAGTPYDKVAFPQFQVQYSTMEFAPILDAAIAYGKINSTVFGLYGFDRNGGDTQYLLHLTGDALPVCTGPGMAWVPDYGSRGALYLISTNSAEIQFIWRVEPPSTNWQNNNWIVTRITMAGASPDSLTTNGIFKRLRYAKSIGCLLWVCSTGGKVMLYSVVAPAGRTGALAKTLAPAVLNALGHNGTNTVQLTTTLVPWNDSFSTLNNAKHLHVQMMPDGYGYLFPKDCAAVTLPGPTDGSVDGNQEIYRIDMLHNRIDVAVPFYIPDSAQRQMSNPDDAFWIPRGNELFYFWSIDTRAGGTGHVHPPPGGNFAVPYDPSTTLVAWTPPTLGGAAPYGSIRLVGGANARIQADRSWRGVFCPNYDTFVIPNETGGQTGFVVIRASDGADLTSYDGSLPWSFGTSSCKDSGIVLDSATGNAYMFDLLTATIMRVNIDAINHVALGSAPQGTGGSYPSPVLQCAPFSGFSGQYVGKIAWHPGIRAVIMPVYDQWYVWQPDNNALSIFQRADGLYNPQNGLWIGSSDTFYDPVSGDIGTIGSINFQGIPTNSSNFPGWYRQKFTLV